MRWFIWPLCRLHVVNPTETIISIPLKLHINFIPNFMLFLRCIFLCTDHGSCYSFDARTSSVASQFNWYASFAGTSAQIWQKRHQNGIRYRNTHQITFYSVFLAIRLLFIIAFVYVECFWSKKWNVLLIKTDHFSLSKMKRNSLHWEDENGKKCIKN